MNTQLSSFLNAHVILGHDATDTGELAHKPISILHLHDGDDVALLEP